MNEAILIFPNQLFEKHPALRKDRVIFLAKDPSYFYGISGDLRICNKKVDYHNATTGIYRNYLKKMGFDVRIINFPDYKKKQAYSYYAYFKSCSFKPDRLYYCELPDLELEKKIKHDLKKLRIKIIKMDSPGYLLNKIDLEELLGDKEHYFFTGFYIKVRKKLNLLQKNGKPEGGKWTYDVLNREKIPENTDLSSVDENIINGFHYPDNFNEARLWFDNFLKNKLKYFGNYQDSIISNKYTLFHSLISPLMNIGLLTPEYVIRRTVSYSKTSRDIPLNSLEGFIRQIIGWREFIRAIYLFKGNKQKNSNFFNHKNKMPGSFYRGSSGIKPFDNTVKKLNKIAYSHHIERLMILGNFMLLCEIDPIYIYKWFMELYIDAYDWVMVPNVFGMSQYADGGLITTKPYFSSSNYILRMSDYKKNRWSEIWDSLFWRFISKNFHLLKKNPRSQFIINNFKKLDKYRLNNYLDVSENFLSAL